MRALSISDNRQNQHFCVEWLIKLYEAQENEGQLMWALRKAAEIAPDNPDAQSRLGHAYYNEGKLSSRNTALSRRSGTTLTIGYSYYSLATIYTLRGEDERALETLKKLVTIRKNWLVCRLSRHGTQCTTMRRTPRKHTTRRYFVCGYKDPRSFQSA